MTTAEPPLAYPTPEPPLPSAPRVRARLGIGGVIAIVFALVINVGAVGGVVFLASNLQRVADQVAVWRFEPTSEIEGYVARSTMTDEGKFMFYTASPQVEAEIDFDDICASQEEGSGILGCYLPDTGAIYLYDVTDDRLDGIEEVVASHEMLHAVWDRLPKAERSRLEVLLEAEVAKRSDDEVLAETLAYYAKAEPGERANELHSIVGTEFADISPDLELYYSTYFTDRPTVAALNEKSQAVFLDQIAQGDALIEKMDALAAGVDTDYAAYNAGYDQLSAEIDDFNYRADNGGFSSQSEFDSERASLMQRAADLDALYASIDARADEYEQMRLQLEDLNANIEDLNSHLNIDPPRTTG